MQVIEGEFFMKKSEHIRKISGLFFYQAMSISHGKAFEIYSLRVIPYIMMGISDHKDTVRNVAIVANKELLSRFSNYAIKKVLPLFLDDLDKDNWRSKLASVEALGNMAYCAPKQISSFLP